MILPGERICKEGYVEPYDIELIIKDEIVSFVLYKDVEEVHIIHTIQDVLKTCEDNVVEETSVYLVAICEGDEYYIDNNTLMYALGGI